MAGKQSHQLRTRRGPEAKVTIFGDVGQRRVHVGEAEDVRKQSRYRHREIVNPHASLPTRRSVQDGALEVGIELLVELPFVLDPRCDGFVGVDRAEFEIRDVALEEVAKVVGDAETFRRKRMSKDWVPRGREHAPFEHRIRIVTL